MMTANYHVHCKPYIMCKTGGQSRCQVHVPRPIAVSKAEYNVFWTTDEIKNLLQKEYEKLYLPIKNWSSGLWSSSIHMLLCLQVLPHSTPK